MTERLGNAAMAASQTARRQKMTVLSHDVTRELREDRADTMRQLDAIRDAARAMLAALRNPAALDEHALIAMDVHTLRATMREYRTEARAAIAQAEAAGISDA
jgi:hypothetical protein